ncbi:MAG: thiamine phosphate synthase [Arcobacteraceae bacterium]|jgi:thiamine-phosphate pyrophosphorylase|nr:thiamine phosphate synthase [Arcobacteraceae bacterium]
MSYGEKLKGLYVITDDTLTPLPTLLQQTKEALEGGAKIVQFRDKTNSDEVVKKTALKLQELCRGYDALFVLNDKITMAVELNFDGLHIGKSDYAIFPQIRKNFKGILGVSCYGDIEKAKYFETLGADYVAFGSFFSSSTKPDSSIVPLEVLQKAKEQLHIPICAIGGICTDNLDEIMEQNPDMVAVISDIWRSENIKEKCEKYSKRF